MDNALNALIDRIGRHRRRGEVVEGEALARKAVAAHPGVADPVLELGRTLFDASQYDEADQQFTLAGELAPGDPRPAAWRIAALACLRRYPEAEALASAALRDHPADPQVRVALGRLHLDRSQGRAALTHFADAVAVAPDDRRALGWYLVGLEGTRQFSAMTEPARKLEELHGSRADARHDLGYAFLDTAPTTAFAHFTKAVEIDPDDARNHEWRVTALRSLNRYDEAGSRLEEAIRTFPSSARLRVEKALLLSNLGRHDDAAAAAGEALEIRPRHPWALRRRMISLFAAHRYDEAEQAAQSALEIWPDDPKITTSLAWALHSQHRYDEALTAIDQALATEPGYSRAITVKITILRDAGRYDEAGTTAAEALKADPGEPGLLTSYAWLRQEQGDLPGALAAIDEAVSGELPPPWALRSRISLLQAAKRPADAEAAAREALTHFPHNTSLRRDHAWALVGHDRMDEAVAAAQQAVEANPLSIETQRARIEILRRARRYSDAETAVEEALELHPASVDLYLVKAGLASNRDDEEAAIAATERALAIAPAAPEALRDRIRYLNYANQFAEAEEAARATLRSRAADVGIHQELGYALLNQGKTADGIAALRAGLGRFPDDLTLIHTLANLLRAGRRYDEARKVIEDGLVKHPDDATLLVESAWVFSGQERLADALEAVERAIAQVPDSEWALRSRIRFLADLGHFEEAKAAADAAEARLPDAVNLVTERGWLFNQQRRYDEAVEAGKRAVDIAPLNQWAWRGLIGFLSAASRLPEAEVEARRAVGLFPQSPGLGVDLAWLISRQDREDEAITIIEEVLAAHPKNPLAWSARISFLGYARRFDEQRQAVTDALALHPDEPEILLAAASTYSDHDRHEEAITLVEHAIEVSPTDVQAHRDRVGTLLSARRFEDAERAAEQVLARYGDDAAIFLYLARMARLRDDHEKAVVLLGQATKADPLHLGVRTQQVGALLPLQRLEEAETIARQAVDDWSGHATAVLALCRVLEYRRATEDALTCLEPALSREPDHLALRLARSRLLRSARRFDEAEREIDRLSRTFPHDWDLRLELGWIQHDDRRLDEAKRTFTTLLGTAADNDERATAHHGRGWAEFAVENFTAAENDFRAALGYRPDDFDDRLGLAWSLTRQTNTAKNRQAADIATDLARRLPEPSVHVCLGVLAFKDGRPAAAEHHFRKALTISPQHGSHTDLGALYAHLGRFEEAEQELKAGIARDWYDAVAHVELGSLLLDLGADRLAEAEREFRQALAADRASTEAAIGLAQTLTKSGEEAEAEGTLRNALKHQVGRKKWQTHLALARLLVQRGDKQQSSDLHAEAYAEAQIAIGLAPDNEAEPHFVAGVAHHRMGSLSADARGRFGYRLRAMNHLRECLERAPGHADAQRNKLLLEREMRATAPAVWGGYAVATISVVLLGVEWVTFYLTDKVTVLLLTTTTPVLVGLFTIAVLLPALIRLKLPGFEADLQAGTASITPGPTGQITFSSRFSVTTGPTGQLPRHGASSPTRTS